METAGFHRLCCFFAEKSFDFHAGTEKKDIKKAHKPVPFWTVKNLLLNRGRARESAVRPAKPPAGQFIKISHSKINVPVRLTYYVSQEGGA